jgi:hypothetical protein
MIDNNKFAETPMGQAVIELSEEMKKQNMPPVSINVIGGFALMMREIRDPNSLTDIDYVGNELPDNFNRLSDKIGLKHNLGHGWINNDVMLTDITMEDFEESTGKLHFTESMEIGNIKINILDEEDVLRMKLIAVDTSVTAVEDGGEFTRVKDLPDVAKLMKRADMTPDEIMDKYSKFIVNENTPKIVEVYINGGEEKALSEIDKISNEHNIWAERQRAASGTHQRSAFLDNYLSSLFSQANNDGLDGP